ncbi:Cro/CI family transcriptional regulator [Pandoraea pnomenusa]|uniref:Cro/CI family transcriptional regulator n=1 Tax=Pandoraea pnomenusa TaxID=93220 RepID=UPI003CF54AF8
MDKIADQIIDALGGTVKVADLCEVSPAAVSQWRDKGIPKPQLRYLKLRFPQTDWDSMGSPAFLQGQTATRDSCACASRGANAGGATGESK